MHENIEIGPRTGTHGNYQTTAAYFTADLHVSQLSPSAQSGAQAECYTARDQTAAHTRHCGPC